MGGGEGQRRGSGVRLPDAALTFRGGYIAGVNRGRYGYLRSEVKDVLGGRQREQFVDIFVLSRVLYRQ